MTQHRKPSVTVEVFRSLTGEFHPALVNRRGRVLWQGSASDTHADALARAETERTARYLRLFASAPTPLGGAA